MNLAGCLMNSRDSPVSTSPAQVLQTHAVVTVSYMVAGHMNLCPHAFKACILPTEPSHPFSPECLNALKLSTTVGL